MATQQRLYCRFTGKLCHFDQASARRHLVGLRLRHRFRGSVFRCGACGAWHVGQDRGGQQRPHRAG